MLDKVSTQDVSLIVRDSKQQVNIWVQPKLCRPHRFVLVVIVPVSQLISDNHEQTET